MNTTEEVVPSRTSILSLVRSLTEDTKKLLRQEVELAKAELSEKVAVAARNAMSVAIGGSIAYAGLIVLVIGLGWLLSWALQEAGLQPVLAEFAGMAIIGVVVILVGTVLLMKGLKTFSQESLAPQRTIHTIQRLKGEEALTPVQAETKPEPKPKSSSEEIQVRVEQTEDRLSDTLDELGQRLNPRHIQARVKQRIRQQPYRSGLMAMAAGLVSGLFLTRSARRS